MWAEKLYAILLRLYPSAFREEYEREMRATFRRRWRSEPDAMRRGFLWLSVISDTILTSLQEHSSMLMQDLRYSLRGLGKNRGFTAAVVATLALGIGATTAVYSLFHTVLLRPLPYTQPDRLVRVWETNAPRHIPFFSASVLNFLSWQQRSKSFEALAAGAQGALNLTGDGEPERVNAMSVSAGFWPMTGLRPVRGRAFLAEEDVPGRDQVVMLSEGLWRRRYGSDPAIFGRSILVNGTPQTVVGIAPQDVGFRSDVDVWTPLAPDPAHEDRGDHEIMVIGRLKPGVDIAQARSELNAVAEGLEHEYPASNAGWRVRLTPVKDWIVGSETRTNLYVLLGAAGLLLLVACANVASLLVTRATARSHEWGVRMALGASRARLLRQLATESLVLAALGGGGGVLIAFESVRWLATRISDQLPRTSALTMDWPVLLFGLALTLGTGLLFGLAPAFLVRRRDIQMSLRQSVRGATAGAAAGIRLGLIGAQIAMATMLVVGALLLIQSFARLQRVDIGFKTDHLLTASISLPFAKYGAEGRGAAFFRTLQEEIQGLPGAVSTGFTSAVPLDGSLTSMPVVPVERPSGVPERGLQAFWRMVSADYLGAIKVPLRRGRLFDASDAGKPAIVLSEGLARSLWPDGSDPVGRDVRLGNGKILTVIGIVGDMRFVQLHEEPAPAMYFEPFYWGNLTVVVRTQADPVAFAESLRQAVKRVDPAQPIADIRSMDRLVEQNSERSYLQAVLFAAFAVLAILLGAVGVAGVVAYTVERRRRDLAVRLALGATPGNAMRAAARGGLIAAAVGLGLGLAGAWELGRFLTALLYQVRSDDPSTFILVGAVLLAVAILACWLPARRVTRIDPIVALRAE